MGKRLLTGIAATALALIVTGTAWAEQQAATYLLHILTVGSGRVVGKDISCSKDCTIPLPEGTEVVLSALPASEWRFVSWAGACKETGDCRVRMDGDKTVEAIFTYP